MINSSRIISQFSIFQFLNYKHGCLLQTFGELTRLDFDGKQVKPDVFSMTDRPKDSDLSIKLVFNNADVSEIASTTYKN